MARILCDEVPAGGVGMTDRWILILCAFACMLATNLAAGSPLLTKGEQRAMRWASTIWAAVLCMSALTMLYVAMSKLWGAGP